MGASRRPHRGKKRRPVPDQGPVLEPKLPADAAGDSPFALLIAAEVVREAEATRRPADRLLRESLRQARLSAAASALAARLVFTWFRWRGFVLAAGGGPDPVGLKHALDLADRFAREPGTFDPALLLDAAVPGWLRSHWSVSAELVRAWQTEPPLWLRARPGDAARLAADFPGARAGVHPRLADAVLYAGATDVFRSPAFAAGRCEIQDVASQAVGVICAPQPGEKWWDACAGEGGKTLHLCDQMANRGVVWASDRSTTRLEVLRRRAARAKLFNYRAIPWAGGPRPPTRMLFDGVLVDAPCTGVGTWHRNPHARWTTGPADVRDLAGVQDQLLAAAARAVRPGGRLIYAVCTLTREETDGVAETFAAAHPDFAPAPFANPFALKDDRVGRIAWEPQITGGNGMFVSVWQRAGGTAAAPGNRS